MLAGTQKPMLGMKLNRAHPLAKGLRGCWLFNEGVGNIAYDTSGYGNHGTLESMAFPPTTASGWNPGKDGIGLIFDGSSSYINCDNDASLSITDTITVEAWVFNKAGTSDYDIVAKYSHAGYGFILRLENGKPYFRVYDKPTGYAKYMFGHNTTQNEWIHIIGTYQKTGTTSGGLTLYVNGEYENGAGSYAPTGYFGSFSNFVGPLKIGMASYFNGRYFNGSIDRVKIYNRALNAEEVKWLYREPYAMFERGELLL